MNWPVLEDLEKCLRTIWNAGEWTEDHDTILAKCRAQRGESAKTPWRWWIREAGEELYQNEFKTREAAISWAVREYDQATAFDVIEARCWADDIQGDENNWFAETRNAETIVNHVLVTNQ